MLDRVRGKIRLKHYSIRTEQAYTYWIKRFILHFGKRRHPRDMGAAEVEQFLTHLAVHGKVVDSTKNQLNSFYENKPNATSLDANKEEYIKSLNALILKMLLKCDVILRIHFFQFRQF